MNEPEVRGGPSSRVLLLSGGVDSAALATWRRPDVAVFIDYGQRPRVAERRAAAAVARELNLHFEVAAIDLSPLGGGLLHDDALHSERPMAVGSSPESATAPNPSAAWPSPEWWPYRNQLLVSFAAAWAMKNIPGAVSGERHVTVETGTVASDGTRHADGTGGFYQALNNLLQVQEGSLSVLAPALDLSTTDLIAVSGVGEAVLGWTHSCHRSSVPCAECPGCYKREQLLSSDGRFHALDAD